MFTIISNKLRKNPKIGNMKPNIEKHVLTTSICITPNKCEAMHLYVANENSSLNFFEVAQRECVHVFFFF